MATTEHKGNLYNNDVVGYKNSYGTFYGYRLLKLVYIDAIGDYRWLVQSTKVNNGSNEAVAYGDATQINIASEGDLKDSYPLKWSKDPEYKKGDILVGKKKNGGKMLFVYLANDHVERLTERDDMLANDGFGYSTLSDYETNFGPLTIHRTQGYSQGNHVKFSDL